MNHHTRLEHSRALPLAPWSSISLAALLVSVACSNVVHRSDADSETGAPTAWIGPEPPVIALPADAGLADARAPGVDVRPVETLTDLCALDDVVEQRTLVDWETPTEGLGNFGDSVGGDNTIGSEDLLETVTLSEACTGKQARVARFTKHHWWGGFYFVFVLPYADGRDYEGVALLLSAPGLDQLATIEIRDVQTSGLPDPETGEVACYFADNDRDGIVDTGKDEDGDGAFDPAPEEERCTPWAVITPLSQTFALHLVPWSILGQRLYGKQLEAPDHYMKYVTISVRQPTFELWVDSVAFYRRK